MAITHKTWVLKIHQIQNKSFRYDESGRTSSEDEGIYSLRPPAGSNGRLSGPPSVISAPDILVRNGDDLTPKHYIRSPIIEETDSHVEAELRSRDRLRDSFK